MAIVENSVAVTYAILADRADRVTAALRRQGIGSGSLVGLHMERSPDYVGAVLGVLASGAAVVPLPPSYPSSRKREILDFAALSAVIEGRDTPLEVGLDILCLSIEALATAALDAAGDGSADTDPEQAAFVLSSSGSTGVPKMISRSHRSFFHRLEWTWERHPYRPGEVCCQKSHMTTTHAIYELFEPLLQGVPVVLVSDAEVRDLEQFWDLMRQHAVSRLLVVPSVLRASLDLPRFVPPALDVLVLMGEHVPRSLVDRILAVFPPTTRAFSIYGSTEASSTLVADLRAPLPTADDPPLGVPISNDVDAFVLAPDGTLARPGETGRLHIAGSALFSGYLRDAELTASVLRQVTATPQTLYDTRDDVRRSVDGSLHFVGRADHVVKVRGFRVDLHEVERALQRVDGVSQAVIVPLSDDVGVTSLLGFVTPASVDSRIALAALREQLPSYMLPSRLQSLDVLPMTSSGKVDRRSLAEQADGPLERIDARGGSAIERQVADAWVQTLGHDQFSADASFFEVGGTSLSVFVLLARLRETLNLDRAQLTDALVYRYPTVRELARLVERVRAGQSEGDDQASPYLVTLKRGRGSLLAPFFVIASAGGTLGAYDRLTRALDTERDIVGIRDTFVWGGRDPREHFAQWVEHYLTAIRERQPDGPYYIGAYSSAGAFGYEIAQRLRDAGQEVALLALIDPIGIDRRSRGRFGWWAMRARYANPLYRTAVRLAGWMRLLAWRARRRRDAIRTPDTAIGRRV